MEHALLTLAKSSGGHLLQHYQSRCEPWLNFMAVGRELLAFGRARFWEFEA